LPVLLLLIFCLPNSGDSLVGKTMRARSRFH
jgi:hypothetical protein